MSRPAVLLINLGSPDSPSVADVRRYLREFLSDPRVLDSPWLIRQLVLNLFILPSRPKTSAAAYQKIWLKEGSPLVVTSRRVQALLQQRIDLPVELAMRYGNPSISAVVDRILERGVEEILLIPLYPQHAMSSYETVVERVREVLGRRRARATLRILPPFFDEPGYLRALAASAAEYLGREYDHLLFSFHGLPERHIKLGDISGAHCLARNDCCVTPHPAHRVCYRAQALATVRGFAALTGITEDRYSVAFQSRLGREPWLKPYTDHEIPALARRGVKTLLVICPAFVADCLETIEEIGIRGKEMFLEAGGRDLTLIPCLNEHPLWIDALARFVAQLRQPAQPASAPQTSTFCF